MSADVVEVNRGYSRRTLLGQLGWVLFDGTRGPYTCLVLLFVFAPYFATVVIPEPVRGQALWGYANSISALLLAVGAPIVGAIADAGGHRKTWIAGCMIIGAPAMALLWFATPAMAGGLVPVLAALVVASASLEYASIFSNAMLTNIAPPSRFGLLSGLGLSFANLGGVAVLLFFLLAWEWSLHPVLGFDPALHQPERACGPIAALWWVVFSIPLLLWTPDVVTQPVGRLEAVRQGFRSLVHVIPKLREHRNATRFLIARMLYNEGFIVVAMLTGIYAAGTLHWTAKMLILQGLINSVFAVVGGLTAGRLDRFLGARASTLAFLGGSLIVGLIFSTITPTSVLTFTLPQGTTGGPFPGSADKIFVVTMAGTALFITAAMASSRALMARLSPPRMQTEFFALYALSGTATAFFGPLAMGLATSLFGDQRAGVAVGVLFITVGLILLIRVRESAASARHPPAGNWGNVS